ncbi:Hypothetical protein CINCED_3A019887 [Cinara cedri]|uniref:Uncharacterized protein n=1 Tax=Cinara cedri TaxID=506608 RepID=A0A5E4NNN6_9HEMI|nr:Hypothetical protein CINCED_3A019887 [Cinara cedri]
MNNSMRKNKNKNVSNMSACHIQRLVEQDINQYSCSQESKKNYNYVAELLKIDGNNIKQVVYDSLQFLLSNELATKVIYIRIEKEKLGFGSLRTYEIILRYLSNVHGISMCYLGRIW